MLFYGHLKRQRSQPPSSKGRRPSWEFPLLTSLAHSGGHRWSALGPGGPQALRSLTLGVPVCVGSWLSVGFMTDLSRWINEEWPLSQEQLPEWPWCSSVFKPFPRTSAITTWSPAICLALKAFPNQPVRQATRSNEGSGYVFSRLICASPCNLDFLSCTTVCWSVQARLCSSNKQVQSLRGLKRSNFIFCSDHNVITALPA